MPTRPDMSIVICSKDGAEGVDRLFGALARQRGGPATEWILVDDGSADDTAGVGRRHGARVIVHESNRGLAAARNTGVEAARAEIVAFLDDDCEPLPDWSAHLYAGFRDGVNGVGGTVAPTCDPGVIGRFLERNNPLEPLELDLANSEAPHYRLWLYLKRQSGQRPADVRRPVFSLVGANMAFRKQAIIEADWFDERFTFGAEELDLCRRIDIHGQGSLMLEPRAVVTHHFESSLRDTLRRSKSYGRGSARMFRKWPGFRPTVYPAPLAVAALAAAAIRRPALAPLAAALPLAVFSGATRNAVVRRDPLLILDAYIELLKEGAGDVGVAEGLWAYRNFSSKPRDPVTRPAEPDPVIETEVSHERAA